MFVTQTENQNGESQISGVSSTTPADLPVIAKKAQQNEGGTEAFCKVEWLYSGVVHRSCKPRGNLSGVGLVDVWLIGGAS
jgi:hypothetical protein